MDKRLIDADKLLEWLEVEIDLSDGKDAVLKADRWAFRHVKKEVESGRLNADPIPLPTIKPGDTRQLLHNTIDVMTEKQARTLARTIGLEVSHD